MNVDNKISENLLLNITVNIFITSTATTLVSQELQSSPLSIYLARYYEFSLISLICCYILIQFDDVTKGKKVIVSDFNKMLPWNLSITTFVLVLLKAVEFLPKNLVILWFLFLLINLCMSLNTILPLVYVIALLRKKSVYRLNQNRVRNICAISLIAGTLIYIIGTHFSTL